MHHTIAYGSDSARHGGSLYLNTPHAELVGVSMHNCFSSLGFGAAVFAHRPFEMRGCSFHDNYAKRGGNDIYFTTTLGSENKKLNLSDVLFSRADSVVVGLPRSCADASAMDGPTELFPPWSSKTYHVRCDLSSEGAPWTTFQRRVDTTSFDRDWDAYKTGFSNAERGKDGSFWLGNDHIHELTKGGAKLRVDLCTLPEGNETSRELLQSSNFERLEDWNVTTQALHSNGYVRLL